MESKIDIALKSSVAFLEHEGRLDILPNVVDRITKFTAEIVNPKGFGYIVARNELVSSERKKLSDLRQAEIERKKQEEIRAKENLLKNAARDFEYVLLWEKQNRPMRLKTIEIVYRVLVQKVPLLDIAKEKNLKRDAAYQRLSRGIKLTLECPICSPDLRNSLDVSGNVRSFWGISLKEGWAETF